MFANEVKSSSFWIISHVEDTFDDCHAPEKSCASCIDLMCEGVLIEPAIVIGRLPDLRRLRSCVLGSRFWLRSDPLMPPIYTCTEPSEFSASSSETWTILFELFFFLSDWHSFSEAQLALVKAVLEFSVGSVTV